jgi:hypothetical protein
MLRVEGGNSKQVEKQRQADERAASVQPDSRGGVGVGWVASILATRVRQD